MYRDGQVQDRLPFTMAEDTAALPDGWSLAMDTALAQFCSKHDGKLGTIDQLTSMCQSNHGRALFAPLLQLCGSEFPLTIKTRAFAMAQISTMALSVMGGLPFGDPEHPLVIAFGSVAPLVFARDKKPAIDAALAQFVKPSADKPDLTLDRFSADLSDDPTGASSIFGQVAKGMTNRGAKMFGISTYHGTNPQFWSCRFRGEDGQDAGGLFRDCISNIAEELMSNRTPCLLQSGSELLGKCWVPNPSCHDVQMYKFLGQIMGACIRTGETLAVDIHPYFWKKLAGAPVTWDDFTACAPVIADSMREIENLEESEVFSIADLCLDFTFMGLGNIEIELVPGGADREVLTSEDRDEFCALAKAACMAQFDDQVALIRSGLDDYQIPSVALLLWTPQEFQEKVAGQLDVPIKGLRDNLSLHGNSSQQEHFWAVMERLTMEQRSLMLKFGSGRSRLPCHLTIHLGNGNNRFGTASTCSFEMYLPTYASEDAMYEGIVETIACGSFGNA